VKFTDGYWLMRPGVKAHYATEVRDAISGVDELELIVATRPIRHRGDTLQGPLLKVKFSSPMEDVIRVRVDHFTGSERSGPFFPLESSAPSVDISVAGEAAQFQSGRLSASISKSNWSVVFQGDGKPLTKSPSRGIGYIEAPDGNYVHEQLQLEVGELVYGLGERFTAFVKNGQEVEIWNQDGGTGSEQAYKNIPFYLTNRGYGVFVNHPEQVSFEVASEKVSRVQFSVEGESLDYFLIYGPTPKEVLEKYTRLTGKPSLPPAWSFGLWLTTSFTTDYDEATVTEFIQGMADRDLPLHVFHFDCFWMKEFRWCDFQWDPDVFPDPVGMLQRLKKRGLRICVWINPYIAQQSGLFEEGKANGYFIRKPDGGVWQTDLWQPGMAIVDFTNPSACDWYKAKLRGLVEMGVDAFKTDFGERIPTDAVYFDGSDPLKMHNFYPYLYNQAVFEVLEEARGKNDAAVFARSATSGCQKFPVHWGGDCYSDYPSMAESLRGGLSLGLSGFGFWSHDIGGFEGMPPEDVYKRWVAFGLMSSHSRLHGSSSYRVPWLFSEEACDVLRTFTKLKCRLMPYLFAKAVEASEKGVPLMRAMLLEFPEDPACHTLDRQFMLGDSLLVAPVFSENLASFYLPPGTWIDWFSRKKVEGGRWISEEHGFLSLPLFIRPNSVVAIGAVDDKPDYSFNEGVTFVVGEIEDGASKTIDVVNIKGEMRATFKASRAGNRLRFDLDGDAPGYRILLAGEKSAAEATGAEFSIEGGVLLTPKTGSNSIEVTLQHL
jgi:alpha-D-xyloside xylohydrolase